jgi:peptidylamidoglycolate lyase
MTRTIRMLVSVASVLAVFSYRPGSDMRASASSAAADYKAVLDWLQLPHGRDQLGNMHGDVAVGSTGDVYVSVQDTQAGLQVYAPDGRFLRNVPDAPADLHGFVIRRQPDGEFIFGPTLRGQTIVKMTLDGKVVLAIPASAIPAEFKVRNARSGQLGVLLTGMDVAPNGDLYVTDGYASDYIHRFDKTGKYLTSFGGKKEPYNFNTLHKLAIDTRFQPARIIACDRTNNRVVHLSLSGDLIGVVVKDLLLPAAVTISGDYAIVGELKGQVTILDKAGQVVTRLGTTPSRVLAATNSSPINGVRASWFRRTGWRQTIEATCLCRSSTSSAEFIGSTDSKHQSGAYSRQRRQTSERRRPQWQRNSGYSQAWPWSWLAAVVPKRRPASCKTPRRRWAR